MTLPTWTIHEGEGPIVAVALHAGHRVHPEVEARLRLSPSERLREEDPFTDVVARALPSWAVVHRSRFEVDMNRSREACVYRNPDEAWGLDVWAQPPDGDLIDRSRALWDAFHERLRVVVERVRETYGACVIYDVHSYNHRRGGPDALPESASANPEVNLGTGALPRRHWAQVVDTFLASLATQGFDVRENVRFQGGHLSDWVTEQWPGSACALAIEFKKTFMDEWTGTPDLDRLRALAGAVATTAQPVGRALTRLPGTKLERGRRAHGDLRPRPGERPRARRPRDA
jgi:N-formylglutamate amidohydrolase